MSKKYEALKLTLEKCVRYGDRECYWARKPYCRDAADHCLMCHRFRTKVETNNFRNLRGRYG